MGICGFSSLDWVTANAATTYLGNDNGFPSSCQVAQPLQCSPGVYELRGAPCALCRRDNGAAADEHQRRGRGEDRG